MGNDGNNINWQPLSFLPQKVTGQQIEDEWLYDKQLAMWSQPPDLKAEQ